MAERHSLALAELGALGMALAQALAATGETRAELTLAFHRLSRSVRQTFALESRLEREARQAGRERAEAAEREAIVRAHRRRAQVRSALSPLIWTEAEGGEDEADALFDDLNARLAEASDEAFLTEPLETCVARIAADMGLPVPPATSGEEAPAQPANADEAGPEAPAIRRSSA